MDTNDTNYIPVISDDEDAWLMTALNIHGAKALDRFLTAPDAGMEPTSQTRWDQAVQVALDLARLQAECRRIPTPSIGFKDYLHTLAAANRISLQPLLRWAGLENISQLQNIRHETAYSIGRLARALGMSLQQALYHVNIDFAIQQGAEFPEGINLAGRSTGISLAARLEGISLVGHPNEDLNLDSNSDPALDKVRASYSPTAMDELLDIEMSIEKAYEAD
jgi:hypothetical protein